VAHAIPRTFGDLTQAAAKDNNNADEGERARARTGLDQDLRGEQAPKSYHTRLLMPPLNDLLLTGTSAVFTATPSCTAMKVGNKQLAFRLRMQFGLKAKLSGAAPPHRLSCATRSRAFLGTNPAHLRRTGVPIHPTAGSSTAREWRVRGALNALAPAAGPSTHALRAMWLEYTST
jgi:hypothetical protein